MSKCSLAALPASLHRDTPGSTIATTITQAGLPDRNG